MSLWIWFAMACVLVLLELATGTFYMLMIAIGMLVGGMSAWLGMEILPQILLAGLAALLATLALRRTNLFRSRLNKLDATQDPNVNLDIGQRIQVNAWSAAGAARVQYRGAEWDVRMYNGEAPVIGAVWIRAMEGSCLLVSTHQH